MARRNTLQLAYQAIRIEGGLIPADELARLTTLAEADKTEQTESNYGVPKGLKIRDEMGRYWKIAQNLWADFQSLRQRKDLDAHQVTVQDFLVPLLRDVLGFTDLTHGATVEVPGHTYNIGYAARAGRLPVILAAHNQALDTPVERFGELNPDTGKTRRRSPFMLAQEALNASDQSLWALASNGLTLRILRDNPSLTRPAYVEVDLEALFSEELYADFTAFWLLAHASRFGAPDAEPADCPWERWRSAGQEAGVTVRSNLRFQVAEALRALGTGFLSHPSNAHLRELLQNGEQLDSLTKQAFFEELLGLVYRLIFLATVEDRPDPSTGQSLIFLPDMPVDVRRRYLAGYSLTWLRERAVRRSSHDTHSDLWQALSITFDALAEGQNALGLPALGGLFEVEQCPHLAGAQIENRWLLAAVFQLGYFRQSNNLTRVNYRDMGPEELGSVYESLLELVPDIQNLSQPYAAKLAFVGDDDTDASTKGNTRKLTGSYYTPDSLVQELIKSALEPVIADTVRSHPELPVDALLALTICDPACGSGHFLLAAARRLADEVAKLRASSGAPTPADYRHALRDVVSHCIYGVDKNPMAIALAKTALWLEAYTPDLPLTFLDHHLQVGDALLGVLDPKILENGIPDEAFAVLSGDDKATAAALKKQNRADLKSWKEVAANDLFQSSGLAAHADTVEQLADDTMSGIAAKRSAWAHASALTQHSTLARLADTYVAAFLVPKLADRAASIPLSGYLWGLLHPTPGQPAKSDVAEAAFNLCRVHSVFHWWLAFPQVAAKGGFAVMLGNPPWERIKLQEEEFFATRSPLVAMAKNKSERGQRIELLRQGLLLHTLYPDVEAAEGLSPPNRAEMRLHEEFISARRGAEAASLYSHDSGRYPLTGVGDVNTYALFAETMAQLVAPTGRAGFIVPTGIATDDSTKAFFGVVADGRLVSLHDLRTGPGLFSEIGHQRFKFCLLTIGQTVSADFLFFALRVEDLADPRRHFQLTPDEFRLLNPNTLTCPVFRTQRDAELTKKLYRSAPVLIAEGQGEGGVDVNPWGISFQRMFDMSTDSTLFLDTRANADDAPCLPLYEAKMVHQFDHRWATYVDAPEKPNGLDTEDVSTAQKADPAFTARPRYWVEERKVLARIAHVPSRVANAWLAWHAAAPDAAQQDAAAALNLALAGWVAGALFRQAASDPTAQPAPVPAPATGGLFDDPASARPTHPAGMAAVATPSVAAPATVDWDAKTAWDATQTAERLLAEHHPVLADALKGAGTTGKKALAAFTKWALQDDPAQGLSLSEAELVELQVLQHPTNAAGSAIEKRASSAYLISTGGQFDLNFLDAWMDRRSPRWLMGWRDICRSTDERTVIASVVPRVGVGHKMPVICFPTSIPPVLSAALYGNLCALVLDYAARQKVGGTSLTYHYFKQFPVLPPERYTEFDLAYIVPRVLELTHTAHDMLPWADDLSTYDQRLAIQRTTPFTWDPERRAFLRAELDAYYARLYGLTREELSYILDPADVMGADYPSETFRVLKNNEMREFGEYRTQRLVLEAWDRLSRAMPLPQSQDAEVLPPLFPERGVISNLQEAEFAGLLVNLISQSASSGISGLDLSDSVACLPLANSYLEPADAQRMSALISTVDALSRTNVLSLVSPILHRLEACGSVLRRRSGDSVLYSEGVSALPADVICKPEHLELAHLMLRLMSRRAQMQNSQDSAVVTERSAASNHP